MTYPRALLDPQANTVCPTALMFKDYYARICSQDEINNAYLSQVYDSFFDQVGLKNE